MRTTRPLLTIVALVSLALAPSPAAAQDGGPGVADLPPPGYGSLKQGDLALQGYNDEIEIRFVPLDERVTRLLAWDAYSSLRSLVNSRRRQIDSVASSAGISNPGLALVSFFGRRAGARYDPQTVTVQVRNRVYRPLGIVPFSPRFTSQQLDVRQSVSAIYLFEETIPVTDAFTVAYRGFTSDDWSNKRTMLDRERARVSARARAERPDTLPPTGPALTSWCFCPCSPSPCPRPRIASTRPGSRSWAAAWGRRVPIGTASPATCSTISTTRASATTSSDWPTRAHQPAARASLLALDPRNITLEPEYYADVDAARFARVKPLLWLWYSFDRTPLGGQNVHLGVRFRRHAGPASLRPGGPELQVLSVHRILLRLQPRGG